VSNLLSLEVFTRNYNIPKKTPIYILTQFAWKNAYAQFL